MHKNNFLLSITFCIAACSGNDATNPTSSSAASVSSTASSTSSSEPAIVMPTPIPETVSQSVVRFVYFIEQGESFNQATFDALKQHAFAMQLYWHEQFGGTFYLYDGVVDIIYGDHNPDWYLTTPDNIHNDPRWYRLGNMKNEVYRKLGVSNFDNQVRVINYPTTRHDGRVGGNFGGAWMDGDDLNCLLGANNGYNFPYDEQGPAHCLGHVAHEFGHVYGLDHTGLDTDCMRYGFYINSNNGELCTFGEDNRNIVRNNSSNQSFLAALPGQIVTPEGTVEAR